MRKFLRPPHSPRLHGRSLGEVKYCHDYFFSYLKIADGAGSLSTLLLDDEWVTGRPYLEVVVQHDDGLGAALSPLEELQVHAQG